MKDLNIKLKINGVYTQNDVHPVFGDDIKINISREENQIFRREKIEGTFKFVNKDFDLIYQCSIFTKFTLEIYREDVFVGSANFIRTDCEFNLDDKICSVKLTTKDIYEKILNGYDNKYNLVKLAPKRENVTLTKRAILQFYVRGEKVVTNVVGGVHYEQSCKEVYDAQELKTKYHFGGSLPLSFITIDKIMDITAPSEVLGRYFLDESIGNVVAMIYKNENNPRYIIQTNQSSNGWMFLLIDSTTNTTLADAEIRTNESGAHAFTFIKSGTGSGYDSGVDYASGTLYYDGDLFCRLLLPKQFDKSEQRSMDNDITDYDSNYPYVGSVSLDRFAPKIKIVADKSEIPTEWGMDSKGEYFVYPTLTASQQENGSSPIPIGQSHWERMSSWLLSDDDINDLVDDFDTTFVLKDSYPIWSAIAVLLKEIDDTITFEGTQYYSDFLYLRVPSPFIRSYDFPSHRNALYITPISNIKKTFYEQAAQKGEISLKQILDMLRNVYNCYWFIDSNNRLRIEHIVYFKNGNSYTKEKPKPSIDVTIKKNLPTGESWGFAQNTVEYETGKCPARYEFKWGDNCTYPFVGEPIDVKDIYLDASRKESVGIENFLADIDYIISNPSEVSNDLFAVFEVNKETKKVDILDVRLDDASPKYRIQNPYLSMIVAERYYYPFDLSGWNAYAGQYELDVYKTKGIKKQTLSCPLTLAEMRSIGVIRTELGNGTIDKLEAEINTLYAKNTIYYEEAKSMLDKIYYLNLSSGQGYIQFFNPTNTKVRLKVGLAEGGQIRVVQYLDIPLKGNVILNGVSTNQTPVLMNAEDISAFTINRQFRKICGAMRLDSRASSNGKYVLEISASKEIGSSDYAGIYITANRAIKITLQASTAVDFDFGYISINYPAFSQYDDTEVSVSGTDIVSKTIYAGDSRYIGFSRDGAFSGNANKVTITIEEV